MPRIPKYRLHRASGQALVAINGTRIYLGKHGSATSKEKYRRLIAEWLTGTNDTPSDSSSPRKPPVNAGISINEMLLAYLQFAGGYYVDEAGQPTKELEGMRDAVKPLKALFGMTPASEFGPKSLKTVRQHMVSIQGLARTEANKRIGRIKRVFKWAVAEELVPPSVYHGLQAVAGLRYGRSEARETDPVQPVDDKHVDAVLPFVSPQIAAMIQVQRLCGMRPCEVVRLRPCDIDQSGEVWVFEPEQHKNKWRGHRKFIPIGPKAQAILQPFLDRDPESFCFSPKEVDGWWRQKRAVQSGKERKTPVYPCEKRRLEREKQARRKRKPKRPKRDHYDSGSYGQAIGYGIKKANKAAMKKAKEEGRKAVQVEHWSPNQLRHTRATEIRKQHGVEAAQVVLGHARADVTQVYAEKNLKLALEIAKESG